MTIHELCVPIKANHFVLVIPINVSLNNQKQSVRCNRCIFRYKPCTYSHACTFTLICIIYSQYMSVCIVYHIMYIQCMYRQTDRQTYIHSKSFKQTQTYVNTYLRTVRTYVHVYMHACIHACIYIHTDRQTYIHTYITFFDIICARWCPVPRTCKFVYKPSLPSRGKS